MVLYIEDGMLNLHCNRFGEFGAVGLLPLQAGAHRVTLEYEAPAKRKGRSRLLVDGAAGSNWHGLSPTLMSGFHEGLDIGLDRRAPMSWALRKRRGTFRYSGKILDVRFCWQAG